MDDPDKKVTRTMAKRLMCLAAASALWLNAGGGVIGVAVTDGQMQVDRAAVSGNSNLAEGSSILTAAQATRIQLNNGNRATLAPNSAARVYADRLVLEKGMGVVGSAGYRLQARGLEFAPATQQSRVQVLVNGGAVQVAALDGPVKVIDAGGLVLARVNPGTAMEVRPGAGAAGTSTVTGTLRQEGGKFVLRDQVTNLDVELRGSQLQERLGQMVQATGRAGASADHESQVIEVASLTRFEQEPQEPGGARPTGGGKPSGGAKPAGAKSGMSSGAKVGIIAAIGAGAGVGIALGMSGKGSNTSVSR